VNKRRSCQLKCDKLIIALRFQKSPKSEVERFSRRRDSPSEDRFSLQNNQTIEHSEFCGEGELEIRTKRSRKWFRCLCPDFMEGRNCEHHLNYCRLYYGQYQKRPCEHYCENNTRAFYCACHDGFMLAKNGYNCIRSSDFYKKLLGEESESLYRLSRGQLN